VRAFQKAAEITQDNLVGVAGMQTALVADIERRAINPTPTTIANIAAAVAEVRQPREGANVFPTPHVSRTFEALLTPVPITLRRGNCSER
jgi:predicted transcriptional regulator